MSQYLADPNSSYSQALNLRTHRQQNAEALKMPGYSQYDTDLRRKRGELPTTPSSYADKFSDQLDPLAFMDKLGLSDGSGAYGPIGAEQLKNFGEGAYQLFDKFKPGMEYIAENQGITSQELANMLGTSSSGYQANVDNQNNQVLRQMGRMGIDPTSGAYAAGAGGRAMQSAAGLSGLQQQVRQDARSQDWVQRMQAAGIGLNVAGQGTDALGKATGAYGDALTSMTDMYGNYMDQYGKMMGLDENARQFGQNQGLQEAQFLAGARPALDNTFYGMYKPQSTWSQNATPGQERSMGASTFGMGKNAGKQMQIG